MILSLLKTFKIFLYSWNDDWNYAVNKGSNQETWLESCNDVSANKGELPKMFIFIEIN